MPSSTTPEDQREQSVARVAPHDLPTIAEAGAADGEKVSAPTGYELLREIARGGMGVVYRAQQHRPSRVVALKRIHGGIASGAALARFKLEAEAVATLDHPHIVPIYEVGVLDEQPFFSMKLIEGENLTVWLSRASALAPSSRPARIRQGVEMLITVARAVQHAHQRGILHRDLKPGNILLDEEGRPYVTDFGLAKRLGPGNRSASEGPSDVTLSGTIVGTPGYMAPEQAAARKDLTTAVDVYSLGAILFEVLTGRPPFIGDNPLEVLLQATEKEPPRPRSLCSHVDRDLEAVCLRCLEKDPSRRLVSALALAEDLERWHAGKPVHTRPASSGERAWRWLRAHPAIAVLSGLLVLFAAAGVVGVALAWRQEMKTRQTAQALSATLALREGWRLGEQGEVGPAMLWMTRALQLAPAEEEGLRRVARANLAAWLSRLHPLHDVWQAEQPIDLLAFGEGGGLALAVHGNTVQQLDALTGQEVGPALPHPRPVRALAISPDGQTIATASEDGIVRLWDRQTGKVRARRFRVPHVLALAWSRDSQLLAAGARDGTVRVWRADSGAAVGKPIRHGGRVLALAFSPGGRRLAVGGADSNARVWELASGAPVSPPLRHEDDVGAVAFSPDGRSVLTGSDDHTARLWSARDGKLLVPRLEHQDYVRAVAFSPDGRSLATGSFDRTVALWDRATGERRGAPLAHRKPVTALAFVGKGGQVVTWARDHAARVWDLARQSTPLHAFRTEAEIDSIAFARDGRSVLIGGADKTAQLVDARTGRALGAPFRHPDEVWTVALSPDGRTALTGSRDGKLRTWDVGSGKLLREMGQGHYVRSAAFSPDGTWALVGCGDQDEGACRAVDVASGRVLAELISGEGPVFHVAFSPDGSRFATSCGDGMVQVWRTETREKEGPPLEHPARVVTLAFGPDGKRLVTGSTDQRARLWDVEAGKVLGEPMVHTGAVWAVAYRPDGKFVATGGRDRAVRLWEVPTGKPVGPPLRHDGVVWAVTFSPGGQTVWTGAEDRLARCWRLPATELEGEMERVALWCQVVTGLELVADNVQVLAPAEWAARRKRLEEMGGALMPR